MFQGTVEDAESYHLKRGIAVNYKRDISWKAWSFKNIEDITFRPDTIVNTEIFKRYTYSLSIFSSIC